MSEAANSRSQIQTVQHKDDSSEKHGYGRVSARKRTFLDDHEKNQTNRTYGLEFEKMVVLHFIQWLWILIIHHS